MGHKIELCLKAFSVSVDPQILNYLFTVWKAVAT